MAGFNLGKLPPKASSHFAGLDALIKEEKAAAQGMSLIARAAKEAASSLALAANAARSGQGGSMAGNASSASSSDTSQAMAAASGQAGALAERMKAAILQANPAGNLALSLSAEFDRVGGTIITLARRIDAAMKFPQFDAAIASVKSSLLSFATGGIGLINQFGVSVSRAAKAFYNYSPLLSGITLGLGAVVGTANNLFGVLSRGAALAAGAATKLYQGYFRLHNFLSSLGDVAKKTFTQLFKLGTLGVFDKISKEAKSATGSVQGLSSGVRNVGRDLLVAFGVAGLTYKVAQFFKDGISGAMALGETLNKTQVVFGKSAGSVVAQADAMAKAYGIPKGEMLDSAGAIGLITKASGMADEASAKLANNFVRLAADASSLMNIPAAEVLDKIRAGMVGQAEPLRELGILMTEDGVKAEAMRMGLASSAKAISEQAKVAARAAIIQRGLAVAEGDLAATADSAANQFRKAGGGLSNFATKIGELLLPAVQVGVTAFNEFLAVVVEAFESNLPIFQAWADQLKAAMDVAGVVARNFGSVLTIVKLKAQETFLNVGAWLATLTENFGVAFEWIGRNWYAVLTDMGNGFITAAGNILQNAVDFGSALGNALMGKGFKFDATPLLDGFKSAISELPDFVKPAYVSLQAEIDKEMAKIQAKEAARAQAMQNAVKRERGVFLPALGDAAEKDKGVKVAGLAERGTKEAYSAVAKFQVGGSNDAMKRLGATAKDQLDQLRQINNKLPRPGAGGAQPPAVPVFGF